MIQYGLIFLVQDADYGILYKCKKMTEYAFNHGQKIKSIGPEMPKDPVCFPKASNMLRVERGSMRCATCKFLTEETRRRAQYLQDLFIQDQASVGPHLDFIRSPPP